MLFDGVVYTISELEKEGYKRSHVADAYIMGDFRQVTELYADIYEKYGGDIENDTSTCHSTNAVRITVRNCLLRELENGIKTINPSIRYPKSSDYLVWLYDSPVTLYTKNAAVINQSARVMGDGNTITLLGKDLGRIQEESLKGLAEGPRTAMTVVAAYSMSPPSAKIIKELQYAIKLKTLEIVKDGNEKEFEALLSRV